MTEARTDIAANVWKILVAAGDTVHAGEEVAILESMKMEIPVTAPVGGVVDQVHVAEGAQVEAGAVIVTIKQG